MSQMRPQARLIYSASDSDANMLWATRFFAPDPFIFIEKRGKRYLVMNDLEIDRAKEQASVDKVLPYTNYVKKVQARGIPFPPVSETLVEIFKDLSISTVGVPSNFPFGLADALRKKRIKLVIEPDPVWPEREIKTTSEVKGISLSLQA